MRARIQIPKKGHAAAANAQAKDSKEEFRKAPVADWQWRVFGFLSISRDERIAVAEELRKRSLSILFSEADGDLTPDERFQWAKGVAKIASLFERWGLAKSPGEFVEALGLMIEDYRSDAEDAEGEGWKKG